MRLCWGFPMPLWTLWKQAPHCGENGLEVKETVADISARLIVNTASMKLRKQEIEALSAKMEEAIRKE